MSAPRSRARRRAHGSSRRRARRPSGPRAPLTRVRAQAAASTDRFRHVVLLMLENRSFDHMVGALQEVVPEVDGVPPTGPARTNPDIAGVPVAQLPLAEGVVDPDPLHDTPNVLNQLDDGNGRFVKDYERGHPGVSPAQKQAVMAYHRLGSLPALHTLGQTFAVCDGWHCSVPGPTWTNRLFAMSGTSCGRVKMPEGIFHPNLHRYTQPSVFRRIREAGRSYRIYFGDFPLALLLADQRRPSSLGRFSPLDDFFLDAAAAEADFPDFAFLEPRYMLDADDDHPPHDVSNGERLVSDVYAALRANRALWESTLLVVAYDEHGGFYDHVAPPAAIPPDAHREEYTFDRLGVRVPVLLVSPWIRRQVLHTRCDHSALLKSLKTRWALGSMGSRVEQAPDVLAEVEPAPAFRDDTPEQLLPAPAARLRAAAARGQALRAELNEHQRAIVAFSAYLESQTPTTPATTKVQAATRLMQSPAAARQVAVERARRYLDQAGPRARRRR